MNIGVVYPQTEIGPEPQEVRSFACGVAELGFGHILAYEHVLGGDPEVHPELKKAPYDINSSFHEPFALFSYMAAVAPSLGFATGIVILPQRQTALVAKQAASLDYLSGGKFRLGIGLGWNPVEYEALGQEWGTRARRFEEQIGLLRELFSKRSVSFEGDFHRVTAAGLNPLPKHSIPIWIGARSDKAIRRAARIADGYFPLLKDEAISWKEEVAKVRRYVEDYGRDPASFGIEATLQIAKLSSDEVKRSLDDWSEAGVTHLCLHTMGAGLKGAQAHLGCLEKVAGLISDRLS